jgi:peptide chain release factor 1
MLTGKRFFSSLTRLHKEKLMRLHEKKLLPRQVEKRVQSLLTHQELIDIIKENDGELADLAKEEAKRMDMFALTKQLEDAILEWKVDNANQEAMVEIRAGAGGDSACLLCQFYQHMLQSLCMEKGWLLETISQNGQMSISGKSGFKEAEVRVSGAGVFEILKFEHGVQRFQYIPPNSKSIQTQTISVAVLKISEQSNIVIPDSDVKIQTMKASGAGGQSVNTTDSAVRMTHIPTGMSVSVSTHRSQHANRALALKVMQARLEEKSMSNKLQQQNQTRRDGVQQMQRHEKLRTYNLIKDRVVDERLDEVFSMDQGLSPILRALQLQDVYNHL